MSYRFVCIFAFISSFLCASEKELLQSKDINIIMKQIFDQHVDKKEMSKSIIQNSFKVYVDQFDPDRIYLLEGDVRPFQQISDASMSRYLELYRNDKFPEYQELNDAIQRAILRGRKIRIDLMQNHRNQLFQKSASHLSDGYEDWRDPDLKRLFPKDENELNLRIKQEIIEFISGERKRYGDANVLNRQVQTLTLFEKQMRGHENQYLYLNDNGQPMNEAEKQNIFVMHILKALASSLDAHTAFLNPMEADEMRLRLSKEIDGIGIEILITKDGNFAISRLVDGGPAAKSGLIKINDRLIVVDGVSLKNKSLEEVLKLLHGKIGSKVSLVLNHPSEGNGKAASKEFHVDLVREGIPVNEDRTQTTFETFGNGIIGKIQLDSFYQGENGVTSENDVREAIKKLNRQGKLKGVILDFRENSGGFLSEAVKVAGLFISNGIVVISKYFNGEERFYRDIDSKIIYDGPLVILTSKATASAAEIVAQALQDYGVAIIVGDEQTYGKGTIQSQTVTENHSSSNFKVTVGKYYTVSGKTPQIQGVKADIVVPSQFFHENIGEKYLDNSLKEDTIPSDYDDDLKDIDPRFKSWYMNYYTPTIQHKKDVWLKLIPSLKKNSEYRIKHNKNYQQFLNGETQVEVASIFKVRSHNYGVEDIQMAEAVAIIEDMIVLSSQVPGNIPATSMPVGK